MQKCNKCNSKFMYNIIIKSLWKNYSPIICEGCDTQYDVNFSTRLFTILIFIPLIIRLFNYNIFWFTNTFGSFICYIVWIAVVLLVFPFFAKYHTKTM
jgi:CXXC-20-CXXC protein